MRPDCIFTESVGKREGVGCLKRLGKTLHRRRHILIRK